MLLVFVDETGDKKFKDYFGFCIASLNSQFYPSLKQKAQQILQRVGWDPQVEFKGSYLFSASSGCTDVDVERRIKAAHALLDLTGAASNSRMKFTYGRMRSSDHGGDYLQHVPVLLFRALPKAPKGAGKNLLLLACDERSDVTPVALHARALEAVNAKGWVLAEQVFTTRSSFDTVGLMFADLVGYLAARIDTISNDAELFEGINREQLEHNGKIRKLRSSQELIEKVRRLTIFDHESWSS